MHPPERLYESHLSSLTLLGRGKVRDLYDIDPETLLIVTTDRISAFDCVLPDPVPEKGRVLTRISSFWFDRLKSIIPNHLTQRPLASVLKDPEELAQLEGRALIVRKLRPLKVEAVVRGYLIGSGWKDYQRSGTVCGHTLPKGLKLAERLPEVLYTPSTKADLGAHDENIDFEATVTLLGPDLAEAVRDTSLRLYQDAAAHALSRGLIIADTKFEFGLDDQGGLVLIDEALTPDSSRFWPADGYTPGENPPSFDKQYVRDYLESLDWDKTPPAPSLPLEVLQKTAEKYLEAERRLTAP